MFERSYGRRQFSAKYKAKTLAGYDAKKEGDASTLWSLTAFSL
ncbi:hypothetical protein [Ferrithrix thermotolerans]|nr:hypothetical protein [Ferrithrix thermotolerans]